ncbi:MAG: bifunctional adenosylcobinamide kinase/adenosylcobinamide-phosphate guanylyltransferase, partial [Hyphomicrobiales bacterium]
MLPPLSLVIGGAASGKSAFGEGLVTATTRLRRYIATAEALDAEMRQKIRRHQKARGAGWETIEAPLDVAGALGSARSGEAVLLDCASLWLSNHLLAGHDLRTEAAGLLAALADCAAPVVVVS